MPSVYADVRGKFVMDWIEKHTAGATFCRRSEEVREVEGGKWWVGSWMDNQMIIIIICLIAVDGGWGKWSKFSKCSKTCGEGVKKRFRDCNNPSPSDGGKECEGEHFESEDCNTDPCKS